VKGLGFVVDEPSKDDELSPHQVAQLGANARAVIESRDSFPVSIGMVNAFPEVVMLEVDDGGQVGALNMALADALPDLPVYGVDGEAFLPHISIARFSSHEGLDQLKETLAAIRSEGAPAPTFEVGKVKLIQAHLAEAAPTFDTLASYRLRSG
jgi:2'-5' RNA ligase